MDVVTLALAKTYTNKFNSQVTNITPTSDGTGLIFTVIGGQTFTIGVDDWNSLTDDEKAKISVIDSSGDGTKYLADDGEYKTIGGVSPNYNTLNNKPQINSITLEGNIDSANLGIKTSDLTNDSNFVSDEAVQVSVNTHATKTVYGQDGVHGFRFYNDVLQFYNQETQFWVDIETGGGGGIAPSNVIDPKVKIGNAKLTIAWGDPGDIVVDGQTICTWKGTKLVQKVGAFPENINDGTVLVDNQVKDTYKTNGFVINNLNNGTTYYFALFPYSDENAVNENTANRLTGTPQPYKKMTVNIDLTNSNPATCITYADDAVGMTAGSSAWDEFFGHYPAAAVAFVFAAPV